MSIDTVKLEVAFLGKYDETSARSEKVLLDDDSEKRLIQDVLGHKDESAADSGAGTLLAILKSLRDAGMPLKGSAVSIGGTEFRLLPDGNTLVGDAADKPSAADAAAAVGKGVLYWSVDTDPGAEAVEVSNGTTWAVMV